VREPSPAPAWFVAAVLALVATLNGGLPAAWRSDPSNRFGLPAFLAWAIGAAWLAFRRGSPTRSLGMSVAGLSFAVIGQMGNLEVLKQVGLATAVSGLFGTLRARFLVMAAASAWTPAWGWLAQHACGDALDWLRLPVAITCLTLVAVSHCRAQRP